MSRNMIQYLVLERCDPSCNMARFYVLSIEPSLFGDTTLTREWGRIGRSGQRRVELHGSPAEAVEALETWLRRKRRRGYVVREEQGGSTILPPAGAAKVGQDRDFSMKTRENPFCSPRWVSV